MSTSSASSQSPSASITRHLQASAKVKAETAQACAEAAGRASITIAEALAAGGKLMLCGNGGSAADAQHLATEFVATLDHRANPQPRKALPAIALTTDSSLLTAYSNDFGFQGVFARQVEALGKAGDVLVGISTSGNSANIVQAFEVAGKLGIKRVALTGGSGGKLGAEGVAEVVIVVPSDSTAHIQEAHIALGHAITAEVERRLGIG